MTDWQLILTCEHGGNEVPEEYKKLFVENSHILWTHRGYDIGALTLAEWLSKELDCPLIFSKTTRLLVELNRSIGSRSLFSSFTKSLSAEEKQKILQRFYFPYREEVVARTEQYLKRGKKVLHLSIHSFTPILNGKKRDADIGLLYDPSRLLEKEVSHMMAKKIDPFLTVRYNYPYRGTADGLVTSLRKQFPKSDYVGIEIEMNQRYGVKDFGMAQSELYVFLLSAIRRCLQQVIDH